VTNGAAILLSSFSNTGTRWDTWLGHVGTLALAGGQPGRTLRPNGFAMKRARASAAASDNVAMLWQTASGALAIAMPQRTRRTLANPRQGSPCSPPANGVVGTRAANAKLDRPVPDGFGTGGRSAPVDTVPILLQKSFWGGERKFLDPLMRFARGDVRDHIV
jgi:hypothetical protein